MNQRIASIRSLSSALVVLLASSRALATPTPTRTQVASAMHGVEPQVQSCMDAARGYTGPANVSLVFGSEGNVTAVHVGAPFAGTSAGACIEQAVREAVVPRFENATFEVRHTFGQPGTPVTPPRDAVLAAMHAAESQARSCIPAAGAPSGPVGTNVTFGSSGQVISASVDAPYRGTAAGACIERALRAVTVPPFSSDSFDTSYSISLGSRQQDQPSHATVVASMQRIQGEIAVCLSSTSAPAGTATVAFVFERSGRVAAAHVTGPFAGTAAGRCIERVASEASVPPFAAATFAVSYPFSR